jgi:uncharacterized membrane protein YvbJ
MKCIYCGEENPEIAIFCQECGKKLNPPNIIFDNAELIKKNLNNCG